VLGVERVDLEEIAGFLDMQMGTSGQAVRRDTERCQITRGWVAGEATTVCRCST
jgi:hypothetical protein